MVKTVRCLGVTLIMICAMLTTTLVEASEWKGKIANIISIVGPGTRNAVFIKFEGTSEGVVPDCGKNNNNRYAIDPTTDAGKAQIAVAMSAWANQVTVHIIGKGDKKEESDGSFTFPVSLHCDVWTDTETAWLVETTSTP